VSREVDSLKYHGMLLPVATILHFQLIFHRSAKFHFSSAFGVYCAAVLNSNFCVECCQTGIDWFLVFWGVLTVRFIPLSSSMFHFISKVLLYSCGTFWPAVLTVLWIGFRHTGPISLCVDLCVFICVYFVCFCFILHSCIIVSHGGVDLMGSKSNP